jgi:hypothetical protein
MGTLDTTYTASYAYNNQVGYIFPQPTEVHVSNENQKDKYPSLWSTGYSQFGEQLDPDKLPDPQNTFSLWLDHGTKPTSSSYSYIVLPAASEEEVAAYSRENPITIIANTDKVQAVRHEGLKQTQINFYAAGSLEYTPGKAERQLYELLYAYINQPEKRAFPEMNQYDLALRLLGLLGSSTAAILQTIKGIVKRLQGLDPAAADRNHI